MVRMCWVSTILVVLAHEMYISYFRTYCMPKKSWPILNSIYYIKWVKTSWTDSTEQCCCPDPMFEMRSDPDQVSKIRSIRIRSLHQFSYQSIKYIIKITIMLTFMMQEKKFFLMGQTRIRCFSEVGSGFIFFSLEGRIRVKPSRICDTETNLSRIT